MRKGWIVNLLLLIGVVGLALYALYRPKQDADAPLFKISQLSPEGVKQVRIEPSGLDAITLERRDKEWFVTAPVQARADSSQVQRVLDLVMATSKDKIPATELARFELDRPILKVIFDQYPIAFGTVNPLTQEQYVLSGDAVFLLPATYTSVAPSRVDRLLAHALFRESEKPIGFAFDSFRLEQRDGTWTIVPPAKELPSQDEFNRWADGWRFASSLLTRPASAKRPQGQIDVKLDDGRTLKLGIVAREPDLILSRPDEKLEFQFSSDLAKRLLARPEASPAAAAAPASANSAVQPSQ